MKVKTSITISSELLSELNMVTPIGLRSEFIEKATWRYLEFVHAQLRDAKDKALLEASYLELNREALDALSYQAPT